MNAQVELTSIAMSKNDPKVTKLDKYDVEANIEEVDNSEEQSVFKYGFTALSNPKNVRLAIEGIARISGDVAERTEILTKDENDVPKILTMIYHELFPTFFLLSKTLNVSSPPHTIGEMGSAPIDDSDEMVEETPETAATKDVQENISESPAAESPAEVPPAEVPPAEVPPAAESPKIPETVDKTSESPDVVQPTV